MNETDEAAAILERLLETIAAGDMDASPELIAQLEGAIITLRTLAPRSDSPE